MNRPPISISVSRDLLERCLALARDDFEESDWGAMYGDITPTERWLDLAERREDSLLASQIRLILDLEFELALEGDRPVREVS